MTPAREAGAGDPGARGAPLLGRLLLAARGELPAPAGVVEVVPRPPGVVAAVLGFPGHNLVATDLDRDEVLARMAPGDVRAPLLPAFLAWLAERTGGAPDSLDVVLAALRPHHGGGGVPVREVDPAEHPRVRRALGVRREVRVFEDAAARGLVILGRGLARRLELAVEVAPEHRGRGLGRALVAGALAAAAPEEPVFAQVAPANAASLRALLGAGFAPLGAEVLLHAADPG
jgi:GNAT superfamily N-acetyltransferase